MGWTDLYEIKHSDFFEEQIEKLKDQGEIRRILKGIQELESDPNIGEVLRYELQGYRSLRIGTWRVVYQVNQNIVFICAFGHGHDAYAFMKKYLKQA
jgi:mRNA interferase RelE/StbE